MFNWLFNAERNTAAISEYLKKQDRLKIICDEFNAGEEVFCVLPDTVLYEPRPVRERHSAGSGMSFRVARGVSFRSGRSDGYTESHDELRRIDAGRFVITASRIFFCGAIRTVSILLDDIIDTDSHPDGIRVSDNISHPHVFVFDTSLFTTIDEYRINVTGHLVSNIIDQRRREVWRTPALPAPPAALPIRKVRQR